MNKFLEKIFYWLFSNHSVYKQRYELRMLEQVLPESFIGRRVIDIGCGNGRTTLKLGKVLEPESLRGVDVHKRLIFSAKHKGLDAEVLNVEKEDLSGDLGVLWSVLHHLKNPAGTLRKLSDNFNSLLIRESIDTKRIFEIGHRFDRQDLMSIISEAGIKDYKVFDLPRTKSLVIVTNKD